MKEKSIACTKLVYLPAQWGETWQPSTCLAGGQSSIARSTDTARKSSSSESKTELCPTHQYGGTSELSEEESLSLIDGWLKSILSSSLPASPVNPSPLQENIKQETMTVISGLKRSGSFARYDRAGACVRMSQACLPVLGISDKYSETWPKFGLMLDGACYRLPGLEPHISAKGSGLWRTPDAGTHRNVASPSLKLLSGDDVGAGGHPIQVRLVDQVVNPTRWPTPRAHENCQYNSNDKGMALSRLVRLWPTPTANPPKWTHTDVIDKDGSFPTHPNQRFYRKDSGTLITRGLEQIVRMYPTPTSRDHKDVGDSVIKGNVPVKGLLGRTVLPSKQQGSLNPDWVGWLMGWPVLWTSLAPLPVESVREWLVGIDSWWAVDPATTGSMSRLTQEKQNRVNRLKALGNGQVPMVVARAWLLLSSGFVGETQEVDRQMRDNPGGY